MDVNFGYGKTIYCMMEKSKMVVHCKREQFDIYIGRSSDSETGKFGNFFSHKTGTQAEVYVKTIQEAVDYFRLFLEKGEPFLHDIGVTDKFLIRKMVYRREQILADLPKLRGKVLGCWCKVKNDGTELCHGDVLVELANKQK